jgi:threonine dehydratase
VVYTPTFVDGIGGKGVFDAMWPLVSALLDGALVSEPEEIAAAVRLLVERNRVVAEGAGAAPVAAALSGRAGTGKIACIVSGGNIDAGKLARILLGEALH